MKNSKSTAMKKTIYLFMSAVLIGMLLFTACNNGERSPEENPIEHDVNTGLLTELLDDAVVQESVSHKNLQIFLISANTSGDDVDYVPLKRAMENDLVKITETSNVNQLEVSNTSGKTVFIHAGDIVKGGKQDRTLTYDIIVDANKKDLKLSSFCVESERWSQRGGEEAAYFSSNTKMLSSRDLKVSSKKNGRQSDIWSEVAETQEKLNDNISEYYDQNIDVKANESSSSLELALDNKELKKIKEEYRSSFEKLDLEGVIGFAYAINGELYNIDVYNNKALFKELFDKLLTAAIVEAVTELDPQAKNYPELTVVKLLEQLKLEKDALETSKDLNKRTRWMTKEDRDLMVFTSVDLKNGEEWLHHNIIIKSEPSDPEVHKSDEYSRLEEAL